MPARLLLIEDDSFTKKFYSHLFNKVNIPFLLSEDPAEIMSIVENEDIQLVLLDINLKNSCINGKNISGMELAKQIKRSPQSSHIPIILVSAYKKNKEINYFLENGFADDYITKPITDLNLFLKKINKFIVN